MSLPTALRRACLVIAACLATSALACVGTTEPCTTASRFAGSWRYSATETSPATATIAGTLALKTGSCREFGGSLDAYAVDEQGVTSHIVGSVGGHEVDSTTVQFDALIDGGTRQHLARIRGDSLVGTWADLFAGGASGAFSAKR